MVNSIVLEFCNNFSISNIETLYFIFDNSSFKYLQNVYSNQDIKNQNVSVALLVSEMLLGENGVCRVHGGGFAGTIQAFVKNEYVESYKSGMDNVFGNGSCKDLRIRKYGGIKCYEIERRFYYDDFGFRRGWLYWFTYSIQILRPLFQQLGIGI